MIRRNLLKLMAAAPVAGAAADWNPAPPAPSAKLTGWGVGGSLMGAGAPATKLPEWLTGSPAGMLKRAFELGLITQAELEAAALDQFAQETRFQVRARLQWHETEAMKSFSPGAKHRLRKQVMQQIAARMVLEEGGDANWSMHGLLRDRIVRTLGLDGSGEGSSTI